MWGKSGSTVEPEDPQEGAVSPWQQASAPELSCKATPRDLNPPTTVQLTLPGTTDAVRHALLEILASDLFDGSSESLLSSAEIVLAEVLNNIVEHAYATRAGDIRIILTRTETGLVCKVMDSGAAMPGLCLPKGDFQPLGQTADLPEGGFGWFLIRSLVTELTYQRIDGENRLSFILPDEQS